MFLKQLQETLQEQNVPFAIVGGYAVAIYGVARGTFDIDIILTEDIRNCTIHQAKTDFGTVNVISLEDLIRMKSKTGRIQDEEDVRALRKIGKRE